MNTNKAVLETHSQRDRRWFKDRYVTQRERTTYHDLATRQANGSPMTSGQSDFIANVGAILKQRGERYKHSAEKDWGDDPMGAWHGRND